MTFLAGLLFILLILTALGVLKRQSHDQHQELMSLLNDLATMVGEWLEEQER